mmetsp:Transcript_30493/g.105368  ORF Transcript_30493/g.105368 Transcript_30493/m.105368 type:complete len:233 (-) Transcript_30493:40-738(-)
MSPFPKAFDTAKRPSAAKAALSESRASLACAGCARPKARKSSFSGRGSENCALTKRANSSIRSSSRVPGREPAPAAGRPETRSAAAESCRARLISASYCRVRLASASCCRARLAASFCCCCATTRARVASSRCCARLASSFCCCCARHAAEASPAAPPEGAGVQGVAALSFFFFECCSIKPTSLSRGPPPPCKSSYMLSTSPAPAAASCASNARRSASIARRAASAASARPW